MKEQNTPTTTGEPVRADTLWRALTKVTFPKSEFTDWYHGTLDEARAAWDEDCHRYGLPMEQTTVEFVQYNPETLKPIVNVIATAFVSILKEWIKDETLRDGEYAGLTAEEAWNKMCKDNATETDPLVCHSHDWCDANMAMMEAFEQFGLDPLPENEKERERMTHLWNKAWNIARKDLSTMV